MPDVELKPQVYKDPRPKEYFDHFHELVRSRTARVEGVRDRQGGHRAQRADRVTARARSGARTCPTARSSWRRTTPRSWTTSSPARSSAGGSSSWASRSCSRGFPGWMFSHGGVFPVRRGYQDEEAFITADRILGRGGCGRHVLRGRPLAERQDRRRGAAGNRADRARVGGAGGPGGDPRVLPGAQLEAAAVPEGDRSVRRAVPVRGRRGSTREQQQEVADYILDRIRELHSELARLGRRGAARAQRAARARRAVAIRRGHRPRTAGAGGGRAWARRRPVACPVVVDPRHWRHLRHACLGRGT